MCVTLCLFSALSRRVGALQISIDIITVTKLSDMSKLMHCLYVLSPCTSWHHAVTTSTNQTENGAGQSILQCRPKSPQPTPRSRERHRGMQTGTGPIKSWMGQAEDSVLQLCQLTELKQTKEWDRYSNRFQRLYETLLPEKQTNQSQRSIFSSKKTGL